MHRVNFTGANLRNANFLQANLSGANFTDADLRGVDLSEANICAANFSYAQMSEEILQFGPIGGQYLVFFPKRKIVQFEYTQTPGDNLTIEEFEKIIKEEAFDKKEKERFHKVINFMKSF